MRNRSSARAGNRVREPELWETIREHFLGWRRPGPPLRDLPQEVLLIIGCPLRLSLTGHACTLQNRPPCLEPFDRGWKPLPHRGAPGTEGRVCAPGGCRERLPQPEPGFRRFSPQVNPPGRPDREPLLSDPFQGRFGW
jgi:hypothetical protein